MTPQRRWTDTEDGSMERSFSLLREEMREGFTQIHRRLDAINGKVSIHSEDIASLKQGCGANRELAQEVHALSEAFAAHRARCPYDGMGVNDATQAANARWTNAQLVGGVAAGSGGMLALLEVLEWWIRVVRAP